MTLIDVISYVERYYVYQNMWTPCFQEQVLGEIEQNNPVDKYAAPIKKIGKTVGHIPRRKNAKFAYTIFYLADPYGKCSITVTGKAVNLGDYDVMQVPCILFSLTIIFIIFLDFLMFYQIFLSP